MTTHSVIRKVIAHPVLSKKMVEAAVLHVLENNAIVFRFKDDRQQHHDVGMAQLVHLSFVNKILGQPDIYNIQLHICCSFH